MKRSVTRVGLGLCSLLLVSAVALAVAGALYAPPSAIPGSFQGEYVDVLDVRLRVLREGAGRDLLFLHGSPGSLEDFAPQAQALARSFRVVRYDRPGHGFSSAGESYSLAYNARVARALIERLGLQNVIVIGHSYGGSSALALALLGSPRVAGYVVLDSAVYKHVRPVRGFYRLLALPVFGVGLIRAAPSALVEAQVADGLRREFFASPPPAFIEFRSRLWAEPKVMHAMANEHVSSGAELLKQSQHYEQIRAPIYYAAQRDNPARRADAEHFKRVVPHTVLELLSNTGHYVQFDHAAAVTRLIERAAASARVGSGS